LLNVKLPPIAIICKLRQSENLPPIAIIHHLHGKQWSMGTRLYYLNRCLARKNKAYGRVLVQIVENNGVEFNSINLDIKHKKICQPWHWLMLTCTPSIAAAVLITGFLFNCNSCALAFLATFFHLADMIQPLLQSFH
jgi:hypothetical protein